MVMPARQLEGEDATRLELDMCQNPMMWANARKQKREDVAAANLAAAKDGHLTENDSSGDGMMESMLTGTYQAAAVAKMDSQTFREEAELLEKEYEDPSHT